MSKYGQIIGEPATEYHATPAVSSHRMADFAKPNSPLYYYRRHISKEAPDANETEAKVFGEAFHCLALEGETAFNDRYVDSPKFDKRTKQGKDDALKFAANTIGKIALEIEDSDLIWRMVKSIRSKPKAIEILSRGMPEIVFRHKMAAFDVQCRCDWFNNIRDEYQRPLIADVKTIDHLSNFDRQFHKYGYYKQAGFYQLVVSETMKLPGLFPRFVFIVVEKNEPYQVSLREPDELALDRGRRDAMQTLTELKHCYETNIWPGEPDEIRPVGLPDWVIERT